MAIGTIPPWLDVSPALYQRAIESGAQAGLGLARLRDASRESALARAERDAELNQRLSFAADEAAQNRDLRREALGQQLSLEQTRGERQDRNFDESLGLRKAQIDLGRERLGAQMDLGRERLDDLNTYRGARVDLAGRSLDLAEQSKSPAGKAATIESARIARIRKMISTYRAFANGSRASAETLGPLAQPGLKDKYTADAAGYDAKAAALEEQLGAIPEDTFEEFDKGAPTVQLGTATATAPKPVAISPNAKPTWEYRGGKLKRIAE